MMCFRMVSCSAHGVSCYCYWSPHEANQQPEIVQAIFTKAKLYCINITAADSFPLGHETIGQIANILASNPSSSLQVLELSNVAAGAQSDLALASVLENNTSISHLVVRYDSTDWVATGILRAMREKNVTLDRRIKIHPRCGAALPLTKTATEMKEIDYYVTLNGLGRAELRGTAVEREKFLGVIEAACSRERCLYPHHDVHLCARVSLYGSISSAME
jgi:hypothetical protein